MLAWLLLMIAGAPAQAGEPVPRCGWTKRIGAPEDSDCHHPGTSRATLAVVGGATAGAGTWWFLSGGDSYRSGDPAGQMIGIGLVGLTGAAVGGLTRALSPNGDRAVPDRPGRPTVRVGLGLGGAGALDEAAPMSVGLALDPTLQISDRVQLQPHLGLSPGLGWAVDVDPRPQFDQAIDGQSATFPVGRRLRHSRYSVGAELAWRTRAPREGVRPRLELRWRPRLELRHRTLQAGEADERRQQHLALYPATLGFRWHVSPRQRFTWFVGPRLDWLGAEGSLGRAMWGPLYGEAYYQIDLPVSRGDGPWNVTGRLNLGYVHSNLDGRSMDVGAIIGFMGPVDLSLDLRFRKREAASAWQLTVGQWLGHGGGPYLELGTVLGGAR